MADANQSRKSSAGSQKAVTGTTDSNASVTEVKASPKPSVTEVKASPKPSVTEVKASPKPSVTEVNASPKPSVTEVKASPSITEVKASPSVTEVKASPSVTEVKASPSVTEVKASPSVTEVKASPSVTEVKASPAFIIGGDDSPKTSVVEDRSILPSTTSLLTEKKTQSGVIDEEGNEKKLRYPKSVFFIITNEFCERFSFYGLRTLLAIYLNTILLYDDDTSTVIYHVFISLCYFFPVFGAIIADSLLGKFRTIVYLSIVFAIGNITLTVASCNDAIGIPAREVSMIGLFLIAIGTGGIKPCVAAFGGDQFIVPQQQVQLERFFSIFYFTINSGSFLSTFITPILREDIHCLGEESCYPVAFGVPAVLMVTSIIIFLVGKQFYIMKKPEGNIIMEIFRVIWHALCQKRKTKEKKEHWLDHAENKFGKKSVHDIKLMLRVVFLYIPLPIFWALYDQQGSRWTFQATRMDGQIGSWTLKAEQMQVVNPLLILAFVPLFDIAVYPLLSKCNLLTKPLQRLGMGGILAGLSFLISAFVELSLEPTYAVVPSAGNGQLRFYNGFDCDVSVRSELADNAEEVRVLKALELWEIKDWAVSGEKTYPFVVTPSAACGVGAVSHTAAVTLMEAKAKSYLITYVTGNTGVTVRGDMSLDDVEKTSNANPKIRVIYNFLVDGAKTLQFQASDGSLTDFRLNATLVGTEYFELGISSYKVIYANQIIAEVNLEIGGVYSLLVNEYEANKFNHQLNTITQPNSVHMLWLLPQYIVMTAGEVMYSVTGVQFSFTQAPVSMKAVLQAAWLLTVAFGNVIVVIIAESKIFDSQVYEFLLFAGLMFLDMLIFAAMAWNYKYVNLEEENNLNQLAMLPKKSAEKGGVDNKNYSSDQE